MKKVTSELNLTKMKLNDLTFLNYIIQFMVSKENDHWSMKRGQPKTLVDELQNEH